MARSAKTGTDKSTSPEAVADAVDAQTPLAGAEVTTQAGPSGPDLLPESARETDAVLIVEEPGPLSASEAEPEPTPPVPPPVASPSEPPVFPRSETVVQDRPAPPPAPVIVRKTGFVPVLLGGVIAAGLGYVAAWQGYGLPVQTPVAPTDQLEAEVARITALEEQVAALPVPDTTPQDLTPLTESIAAVRTEMTAALAPLAGDIAAIKDSLTGFDGRLSALERAPAADGTLADTAIAGWEAEIATLRGQIADQQAQLQTIADAAAARLDAAQSTVAQIEQNAVAQAAAALQRAAVTRMQAAMDAGTPFDTALADLAATGVAVPDALTSVAADGVPTIAALTDSFPEAARAALATARAEGLADDGEGRIASFFRRQLGVRSVTPREGSDPDAILSRAEGALREGRLSDTMAEVATLPEVVRAELSGWMASAEGRIAAVAALQALSESLPAPEMADPESQTTNP